LAEKLICYFVTCIIKNIFCSHTINLLFSEEAVGSVIHGYVLTKSSEKARGLWNDMKSGRFGVDIVSGGPTVYNAVILDCIQNNSWSDAREMYDEMKKSRVVPLDSTYVGLLLASFKEGGRRKTMQFIDELVQSRVSVTAGICMMALRLLIPELAKFTEFADMRSQLQSLSDDKEFVYVALIRAMRSAELEEQRQSTKGLPRAKINERRAAAWHEVLKQLTRSSAALFPDEDEGTKSVSS
jgi:pentatricopeptide repeat protein